MAADVCFRVCKRERERVSEDVDFRLSNRPAAGCGEGKSTIRVLHNTTLIKLR